MAAGNIGLAKAGQTEVIEHLYFYQHLCLISADGFQMPCLRQAVNPLVAIFDKPLKCRNSHKKVGYGSLTLN